MACIFRPYQVFVSIGDDIIVDAPTEGRIVPKESTWAQKSPSGDDGVVVRLKLRKVSVTTIVRGVIQVDITSASQCLRHARSAIDGDGRSLHKPDFFRTLHRRRRARGSGRRFSTDTAPASPD